MVKRKDEKIPVVYSEDFLTDYRTVDCENPERAWIIQSAIKEMAEFDEFLTDLETALRDAASFDIVGCSAGFDTYVRDWGGLLFTDDYREIAKMITSSNPHTFTILEGGYYISDLGKNVASYLKGVQEACL